MGLSLPSATLRTMAQQLTSQQTRAIELLAGGMRESTVAETLGINRSTVWRWRTENAEFQAQLNSLRHERWQASIEHLRSLIPAALGVLEEELEGDSRLRAASMILDLADFRAGPKKGISLKPSGAVTAQAVERAQAENQALEELTRVDFTALLDRSA